MTRPVNRQRDKYSPLPWSGAQQVLPAVLARKF
jgi:hypothetical protein